MSTVLFWVYIAVVLRITVFRSSFGLYRLFQNGRIHFWLFQDYIVMLRRGDWFSFGYLFFGNIIWFIPLGMYLRYKNKVRNVWQAVLAGLLFSLLIETLQYVFGTGVSDLDDLVLNAFGAGLGAALFAFVKKLGRTGRDLEEDGGQDEMG